MCECAFVLCRIQAAALQQMQSVYSFLDQLQVKVSFTDTSLSFEGSPIAIKLARDKVEQILSLLQLGQVPSFTVAALLPSLRKRLQMEQVNAYIVHLPPDAPCLAALSTSELQQAKEIAGALFRTKRFLPSEDLARQLQSSSNHWLTKLQEAHSVAISIEAGTVAVCGYIKEDVTAATDALSVGLKQLSVTTRPLECPPAIHTYLIHILFEQPTMENRSFVQSLSVQIAVDENSRIQLEGTPADINEGEKQLLSHFVPPELKHRTFKFTCESRFFFLVENTVLKRLHEEATFLHTHQARPPAHHQRKENQSQRSPSHFSSSTSEEKASFSITIYSKNAEHFERVCAELQVSWK